MKYFGTDGFRGRANEELTAEHAFRIGRFLGCAASGGKGRVLIGKDTRRSSYMLEYALASGVVSSGADAYLLHVTTTASELRARERLFLPSPEEGRFNELYLGYLQAVRRSLL